MDGIRPQWAAYKVGKATCGGAILNIDFSTKMCSLECLYGEGKKKEVSK